MYQSSTDVLKEKEVKLDRGREDEGRGDKEKGKRG